MPRLNISFYEACVYWLLFYLLRLFLFSRIYVCLRASAITIVLPKVLTYEFRAVLDFCTGIILDMSTF